MLDFNDTQTAFEFRTTEELKQAKLFFTTLQNPLVSGLGSRVMRISLSLGFPVQGVLKRTLYRHFCGGETLDKCLPLVERLSKFNVHSVLDYGVEGQKTEDHMDNAAAEITNSIKAARDQAFVPFAVFKPTSIGKFSIYEKVSAGDKLSDDELQLWNNIKRRYEELFDAGQKNDVPVYVDAEESWIQPAIDELVLNSMKKYNREKAIVWNTYQMYRTDRLDYLEENIRQAEKEGFIVGAKLVRGAYLEKERARAAKAGLPSPVHENKPDTDRDFNQALTLCIDHAGHTETCAATHNETSCRMLADEMTTRNIAPDDRRFWFSQLYGMADYLSFNLAKAGFNVARYIPYGPVKAVVPYLMRRAEENASVQSQAGKELDLIRKELIRRAKQ